MQKVWKFYKWFQSQDVWKDRRIPKSIPICYADNVAVRLTCRTHIALLGPADIESSHCEQTDRHRSELWYSRAENYRIIKNSWVNSFVDIKRRCQVSVIEAHVRLLPHFVKKGTGVGCWTFTAKFWVQFQASHVGFVADKEAIEEVFLRLLWFSSVTIILPMFLIQSIITDWRFIILTNLLCRSTTYKNK